MTQQPPASPPPQPPPPEEGGRRDAQEPGADASRGPGGIGGLPITAVIVIVVAVAILVWLLFIRGDDDNGSDQSASATKTVHLVSASELPAEVSSAGIPVYWLGPRPGVNYEVTKITDGRTYVRYLPTSEKAQSGNPYLTVGSYAQVNALKVLRKLAKRPGASLVAIPNGGEALKNKGRPSGVYVAFPGVDTQIEIYDPEAGQALALAKSGELSQIK